MDVVSDLLRAVRFSSAFYCLLRGEAPWGLDIPSTETANFHVMRSGECCLRTESREVRLSEGDVALVARGLAHAVADEASSPTVPVHEVAADAATSGTYRLDLGGGGTRAELMCGKLSYRTEIWGALAMSLPAVVVVRPGDNSTRFRHLVEAARSELIRPDVGAEAVLTRLGDLILVELIRAYLTGAPPDKETGVLAGIRNPETAPVLSAIHREPGRGWTLDRMAAIAMMSRSSFTERFRATVGVSPGEYVRRMRIARAAALLEETGSTIDWIAREVGYGSASALGKAFRGTVGLAPGRYRARSRNPG